MARDAAVHHVARRDDVRARLGVAGGGLREQFQRRVVEDFHRSAGLRQGVSIFFHKPCRSRLHHAAMAVLHVFAQADVRDDQQRRQFLFQQPRRLLDNAIFRVSAGSLRILFVGNAEQQDGGNAERVRRRRLAQQLHPAKAGKRPAWRRLARRNFCPARANSGRTSCSTLKRVSPTSRRSAADCRSRRGRYTGNCPMHCKLTNPF